MHLLSNEHAEICSYYTVSICEAEHCLRTIVLIGIVRCICNAQAMYQLAYMSSSIRVSRLSCHADTFTRHDRDQVLKPHRDRPRPTRQTSIAISIEDFDKYRSTAPR